MPALVRPEYLAQAQTKANSTEQAAELTRLMELAREVELLELSTAEGSRANRIAAGDKPAATRAPKSVAAAARQAEEEIHRLELRKCRRAVDASAIVKSLLQLASNDINANEPVLKYIDLPANLALATQLLARKRQLRDELANFLSRWPGAA